MENIKFRGRNNNKWVCGFPRVNKEGDVFISYEYDGKWYELQVDKNTVGKSLNIKDINGKDVYQGDIVDIIGNVYENEDLL